MTILGPTPPRLSTGTSDYRKLREGNFTYVDKTSFIVDVLQSGSEVLLFTRPRRFGKTLNLSALRHFLQQSEEDLTGIFEDTYIWNAFDGEYRVHFQKYPVIWLSFKEIKESSWEDAWERIRRLIQTELNKLIRNYQLNTKIKRTREEDVWLENALQRAANQNHLSDTLHYLIKWLAKATGNRPVLLIDEYDTALHTAYEHGYWDSAIAFFRGFYSNGLKDQADLSFGVLTGILRMVKASSGSGLNNTRDFNLFSSKFSSTFGFTSEEVDELVQRIGTSTNLKEIKNWYNGYQFGPKNEITIYNPWSVIMYLFAPEDGCLSYWKNSSDNALIRQHLLGRINELGPQIQTLLNGDVVKATIQDNILLDELKFHPKLIWSLLTFEGYLTTKSSVPCRTGRKVELFIPNEEVFGIFEEIFMMFLEENKTNEGLFSLTKAIFSGDAFTFEFELEEILKNTMSYFDFAQSYNRKSKTSKKQLKTPKPIEAVYQAFIIGILLHLQDQYRIRSNREAAYGRADVLIIPKKQGEIGAVLELKVVRPRYEKTPENALKNAIEQLRKKRYADHVIADGAGKVFTYAVVFDGKRCWVELLEEPK